MVTVSRLKNSEKPRPRRRWHGAGIAVASDGDDLSVHDLNVLGERNDAEDGVDVHECDAMLAVDNELSASWMSRLRKSSSAPSQPNKSD